MHQSSPAIMFDVPPKCPALADKLSGLFNWRHTYKVHEKHKGLSHGLFQKSYSLNLPRGTTPVATATTNTQATTTANNSLNSVSKRASAGAALGKEISVRRAFKNKKI